jgi:hypothetical protein
MRRDRLRAVLGGRYVGRYVGNSTLWVIANNTGNSVMISVMISAMISAMIVLCGAPTRFLAHVPAGRCHTTRRRA